MEYESARIKLHSVVGIKVTRAITRVVGDRRKFRGKGRVKSYAIKLSTSSARHNRDLRKLAGLWGKFGRKKIVKVQLLKGISTRALPFPFSLPLLRNDRIADHRIRIFCTEEEERKL